MKSTGWSSASRRLRETGAARTGAARTGRRAIAAAAVVASSVATSAGAAQLSYLQQLLDATPQGGWVQVNLNKFSDAWATPAQGGLPPGTYSNPGSIVPAWSSVAWDSQRGNLLLFGGGHANYMGNEMYVFQGATGTWTRGSLPSRLSYDSTSGVHYVVDDRAPQSAHTYDNSVYVKQNDMYVTFGGAAFNTGSNFQVRGPDGRPMAAGPWMWDPRKADANKVGGTTGSGYLPSTVGGEMWSNQRGRWTGNGPGRSFIETNSAVRVENGKDVIYVTSDSNASGWQSLYRYELGDVRAGEIGKFNQVGFSWHAPSYQSAAAFDTVHNLYVRTSDVGADFHGFGVWDLSRLPVDGTGAATDCVQWGTGADRCVVDKYIGLVDAAGNSVAVNSEHGIAFDERSGKFLLWDGKNQGRLLETQAQYDADGKLKSTWLATELLSTSTAQPTGNFRNPYYEMGVLGKWQYVPELGAFVALDNYNATTMDAGVWLYKPFAAVVPEPQTLALLLVGLGAIGLKARRTRRA